MVPPVTSHVTVSESHREPGWAGVDHNPKGTVAVRSLVTTFCVWSAQFLRHFLDS